MNTISDPPRKMAMAAVAFVMLIAVQADAATFSTNSFADAFVTTGQSSNLSGNNYGGAGALSVAAPGLAQGEFQSVLQFDLSGASSSFNAQFGAGQWSIQSISLSLTAASPNNSFFNASAAGQFSIFWMQNDSWVEGTGTPAAPTTTGITFSSLLSFLSPGDETLGTFSFGGGTSGTSAYSLNLTPGFSSDATASRLVSLRLAAADSSVSYLFDSRNFGTTSFRPLLSIVAIPEPGAIPLLATGAALLLGSACRRRNRPE